MKLSGILFAVALSFLFASTASALYSISYKEHGEGRLMRVQIDNAVFECTEVQVRRSGD